MGNEEEEIEEDEGYEGLEEYLSPIREEIIEINKGNRSNKEKEN